MHDFGAFRIIISCFTSGNHLQGYPEGFALSRAQGILYNTGLDSKKKTVTWFWHKTANGLGYTWAPKKQREDLGKQVYILSAICEIFLSTDTAMAWDYPDTNAILGIWTIMDTSSNICLEKINDDDSMRTCKLHADAYTLNKLHCVIQTAVHTTLSPKAHYV